MLPSNSTDGMFNQSTTVVSETEQDEVDVDLIIKIVTLVVTGVGLITNLCIFTLVLMRHKSKWKKHLILMVNIMVCDMVISASGIIFSSVDISRAQIEKQEMSTEQIELHRRLGCTDLVARRFWDVGTYANLFGLLLMTIDHLIAVRWSLQHSIVITKRWAVISCVFMWVLSLVIGFLEDMLISPTSHEQMSYWEEKGTTYYCYQRIVYNYKDSDDAFYFELNQDKHLEIKSWVNVAVIATVFLTMCGVYTYIAYVVISVSRRKKANDSRFRSTKQTLKGIGTTILLLCSFLILYLPQIVYFLVRIFSRKEIKGEWPGIFGIMLCLTAVLDVFIYACRDKDVQAALKLPSAKPKKYQTAATQRKMNTLSTAATTTRGGSANSSKATSLISITQSHNSLHSP